MCGGRSRGIDGGIRGGRDGAEIRLVFAGNRIDGLEDRELSDRREPSLRKRRLAADGGLHDRVPV
jgi:hypothetical protein